MVCQLKIDERRDERAVGTLDNVGRRTLVRSEGANLRDDLFHARRSAHGILIFLERTCGENPLLALGDEADDAAI